MQLLIQKWGNGAGVRLPAALLAQIGARIGSTLDVTVTKEGLILKPAKRKTYKLSDLLAEMPDAEFPRVEGWDDMPTVGREAL